MKKRQICGWFRTFYPQKNTAKYKKMAKEACDVWKKFGALDYKECMIDDTKPQHVTLTFAKLIKPKPGETIWFSFIVFKSRQHRDAVNKKVMAYFDKNMLKTKCKCLLI